MRDASRGEIWLADLNPTKGHEQAGRRPVLVVSVDPFNHGGSGLVIVIPITSKARGIPAHVQIDPPEGGVVKTSFAMCEAIRSVSKQRLECCWGQVRPETMSEVERRLRFLLGM